MRQAVHGAKPADTPSLRAQGASVLGMQAPDMSSIFIVFRPLLANALGDGRNPAPCREPHIVPHVGARVKQHQFEMTVSPKVTRHAQSKVSKAAGLIDPVAAAVEEVDAINGVERCKLNSQTDTRGRSQTTGDRAGQVLVERRLITRRSIPRQTNAIELLKSEQAGRRPGAPGSAGAHRKSASPTPVPRNIVEVRRAEETAGIDARSFRWIDKRIEERVVECDCRSGHA